MNTYNIEINHYIELIAMKWGCEYPKTFKPGDRIDVDEWTFKELNDLGYVSDFYLIEHPTI